MEKNQEDTINTFDESKKDNEEEKFNTELLFKMELHDKIKLDNLSILKVPGGWIYRFVEKHYNYSGNMVNGSQTSVFVPYSPDF